MKKSIYLVLILVLCFNFMVKSQTRVVCVGNSITEGYGLANSSIEAYPARLQGLLGSGFTVLNCGVSGTCMVKNDPASYWNTSRFNDAKNFDPQILIIKLGTNDGDPPRWNAHKNEFYNDYVSMIAEFRKNGRNPLIYVCYPVPCFGSVKAPQDVVIKNEVIPLIKQVALTQGLSTIDFNTTMQPFGNMFPDNIHPNADGARKMGEIAFNALVPSIPTVYKSCNYYGYNVSLGVGDYNLAALKAKGILDNDISSVKVPSGYKIFGYDGDNFTGNFVTLTSDNSCLGGWENVITSIRVRSNGVTGKNGTYSLQNRNSGIFMDVAGANPAPGTNILQWTGTGQTNQQFTLTDLGDGAYKIISVATGGAVDVAGASTYNLADVLQWTPSGSDNQKFILIATDNNYYKLKAVHSGRLIDVSGAGTAAGTDIIQYYDANQLNGQWKLAAPGTLKSAQILDTKIENAEINVFPNPAKNNITISNVPANTNITIYSTEGKSLISLKSSEIQENINISISNLKSGKYIIKVGDENCKTFKLIKE